MLSIIDSAMHIWVCFFNFMNNCTYTSVMISLNKSRFKCMNHGFLFSVFLFSLTPGALLTQERQCFPRWPIPTGNKFSCKYTVPTTSFVELSPAAIPCTDRARARQLETAPTLQNLLKLFKRTSPKGNQSRIFIESTDAEAVALILRPPEAKSRLIRKDPDAGKD